MAVNTEGAIDVPCSLFSGLNTELAPSDLPEGVSPDNGDVIFLPGSVQSRPGLRKVLTNALPNNATIVYQKTYVPPSGSPLTLFLDSNGIFWKEDPINAPGVAVQIGQVTPGSMAQSVTVFGREYIAFSDGLHGVDAPRQFDGTNFDRVSQDGPAAGPSAADSGTAGSISAGVHQVVQMFLTRSGFITKPSPPISWTAAGGKKVALTNLAIGPANVVARIIGFTLAGGNNFFFIPATVSQPIAVSSTIVADNTSTSATLDFSDTGLAAATAIDQAGNNLFAQVVLGPCLGFFAYSSRLFAWGERNKVQNLLNMGFEGGFLSNSANPLGWSVITAGGALVSSAPVPGQMVPVGQIVGSTTDTGMAWQITGTGAAGNLGQIQQSAYQDYLGVAIAQPNTSYFFRLWARVSVAGAAGTLFAELFSASQGSLALGSIALNTLSAVGGFVQMTMLGQLPAVVPSDLVLRVYTQNQGNGQTITIDELELIPQSKPFLDNTMRGSYTLNPEAFDSVTGVIGPASDPSPIQCCSFLRNTMYIKTRSSGQAPGGIHSTQDNGTGEPATWAVPAITRSVGALSFRSIDAGSFGTGDAAEDWDVVASRGGLYIFSGGDLFKLSQEIQTDWESINWAAQQTVWVKNDTVTRRIYVGVPTGAAVTPNKILVLDYRELDSLTQIASSSPIHISFTGKMIASDLARKWTRWNLATNCGEILARPNGVRQFTLGAGNGQALGAGVGFGNFYTLDATKLTDDDYGQIFPYYTTYFFINHEMEMQLGVGSHRKQYAYLTAFISGTGTIAITPLVDTLANAWATTPGYTLSTAPVRDLESGLNVLGERCAFKFASSPLAGKTDNGFNLQKMVVTMRQDPWSPVAGRI